MLLGGSMLPQFQLEIPVFLTPVSDVICEEMTEENFTPFCVHAPEVQEKFVFDCYPYAVSFRIKGEKSPDDADIYSALSEFFIQFRNTEASRDYVKFEKRKKASNNGY